MKKALSLIVTLAVVAGWSTMLSAKAPVPKDAISQAIEDEQQQLQLLDTQIGLLRATAERKVAVKAMRDRGDLTGIQQAFDQDATKMEAAIQAEDLSLAKGELYALRVIYRIVPEMSGNLMYYDGWLQYSTGNTAVACSTLSSLLQQYPACNRFQPALNLLEKIKFIEDDNTTLISLYRQYPQYQSNESLYWVANALYNQANYDEATQLLTPLTSSSDYALRAESMLAMITFTKQGVDPAIQSFEALLKKYPSTTPYYSFLYLSLARLYQMQGNNAKAADNYEFYHSMPGVQMSDELRFEITLLNLRLGNKDKATVYLNEILANPQSYDGYTSASYLLSMIYQETGDLQQAETYISQAITQCKQIVAIFDTKQQLLDQQKQLFQSYQSETDQTKRLAILRQLTDVSNSIAHSTQSLEQTAQGLSTDDMAKLKQMEALYLQDQVQVGQMQSKIDSLNATPNQHVENQFDSNMDDLFNSVVTLKAMRYVFNLDDMTYDDYYFAYNLATEQASAEHALGLWTDIARLAQEKGYPEVARRAQVEIEKTQNDLGSLESLAYAKFGAINDSLDSEKALAAELERNEALLRDYSSMRSSVGIDYNQSLARQIEQDLNSVLSDQNTLHDNYSQLLAMMQSKVKTIGEKYDYTQMNLMYNRAKELDEQYDALRQQ